ncbi:unnamed protein product, partial [Owenia fusiformis]
NHCLCVGLHVTWVWDLFNYLWLASCLPFLSLEGASDTGDEPMKVDVEQPNEDLPMDGEEAAENVNVVASGEEKNVDDADEIVKESEDVKEEEKDEGIKEDDVKVEVQEQPAEGGGIPGIVKTNSVE